MKKKRLFVIGSLILLSIIFYFGFAFLKSKRSINELEALNSVDQIVITVSKIGSDGTAQEKLSHEIINDRQQINDIVAKMRTYSERWQYEEFSPPWTGVFGRSAPVQIGFFNDEDLLIYLRIGYTQDGQYFLQEIVGPGRYLNEGEFRDLMEFLGVEEKANYYEWERSSD